MLLGIRARKDAMVLRSWHDCSKEDLCHGAQLLDRFSFKANPLLPRLKKRSIAQNQAKSNHIIILFQ